MNSLKRLFLKKVIAIDIAVIMGGGGGGGGGGQET